MNDLVILEFMQDGRIWTPAGLHRNLCEYGEYDFSRRTIKRRMHGLLEEEVIERLDDSAGAYRITEKGLELLEED